MVNYANGYSPVDQNLNQEELMYTNYPQIAGQTNNSSVVNYYITAPLIDEHIVDVFEPARKRLQAEGRLNA